MFLPSREVVDSPVGCRVELDLMDDVRAPASGTKGTVICVDDVGTIHVRWDNGSKLGVVYEVDKCHRIWKEKKEWNHWILSQSRNS